MKILLLSPWFPSPPFGGALIRVHETLRHLSRTHRLTLLAPIDPVGRVYDPTPLTAVCDSVVAVPVSEALHAVASRVAAGLVRGMPFIQSLHRDSRLARQLHRLTSQNAYDVIHVEHSFMSPYLASVSRQSRAKTVLSMHNIESLRFRRELETMRWGARRLALVTDHVFFASWEENAIRRFDGITTVSRLEQDWVRKHAPRAQTEVVPNGVDTEYFSVAAPAAAPKTVVFAGLMNYPPNVDAVVWFCDAVLPSLRARHPDVRFLIVGDKPTDEVLALSRRGNVEVTGRVPDVRPYLADCAAAVVPVRSGAGTRLKILEAMAMGRPVVSTVQGAEGLNTTHGVDVLLADTAEAMAREVSALIENAELRTQLGRAGRRLVEAAYDWNACFQPLDALYDRLVRPGYSAALGPMQEFAS